MSQPRSTPPGREHMEIRRLQEQVHQLRQQQEALEARLVQRDADLELRSRLLDSVRESVVAADLSGRVLYWSAGAEQLYGYSPAEAIGRLIDELILPPEDRHAEQARMQAVLNHCQWRGQYWQQRRNGEWFYADTCISLITDADGEATGFIGIDRDITARHQAEQALKLQRRRLAELSEEISRSEERQRRRFAAALHDEVGQTLFALKTQLAALGSPEEPDPPPALARARQLAEEAHAQTRNLTFEFCPPVLYQSGLSDALAWLAGHYSERHGLDCAFQADAGGPALDEDRRGLLFQAARELLNNVVKHAQASRCLIEWTLDARQMALSVSDDGEGLATEVVEAAASDTSPVPTENDGGGFGLFHLRHRVRMLGGQVRFDTGPLGGTRVVVSLPRTPPAGDDTPGRGRFGYPMAGGPPEFA